VTAVTVAEVVAEMAAQDMAPGGLLFELFARLAVLCAAVLLACGAVAFGSALLGVIRR